MPALLIHGGGAALLLSLFATSFKPPASHGVTSSLPSPSHSLTSSPTNDHQHPTIRIDLHPHASETDNSEPAIAIAKSHEIPEQAPSSNSLALTNGVSGTRSDLQPMSGSRKRVYPWVASIAFGLVAFLGIDWVLHTIQSPEEASWISTSRYWLDRRVCTWFGACGIQHMWRDTPTRTLAVFPVGNRTNHTLDWIDEEEPDPEFWPPEEQILREIPKYVLDHAPYVHLYSGEEFWPSDISEHLLHTTPNLNYTPIDEQWQQPNLSNLWKLNYWGRSVFLKSDDNVEDRPQWLGSKVNIPDRPQRKPEDLDDGEWFQGKPYPWQSNVKEALKGGEKFLKMGFGDLKYKGGERKNPPGVYPPGQYKVPFPEPPPARHDGYKSELRKRESKLRKREPKLHKRTGKSEFREQWKPSHRLGGRSDAPAVLIVVDKGHGVVDAFWFFFYSYNLGNTVFNVRFGNHVGDWEHTMVRFYNGTPKVVFFSEHSGGEAYTFEAVERFGKRVSLLLEYH